MTMLVPIWTWKRRRRWRWLKYPRYADMRAFQSIILFRLPQWELPRRPGCVYHWATPILISHRSIVFFRPHWAWLVPFFILLSCDYTSSTHLDPSRLDCQISGTFRLPILNAPSKDRKCLLSTALSSSLLNLSAFSRGMSTLFSSKQCLGPHLTRNTVSLFSLRQHISFQL